VFEMRDRGLAEVSNPSELFLGQRWNRPQERPRSWPAKAPDPSLWSCSPLVRATSYASAAAHAPWQSHNRLHQILAVWKKHLAARSPVRLLSSPWPAGLDVESRPADLVWAAAVSPAVRDLTLAGATFLVANWAWAGSWPARSASWSCVLQEARPPGLFAVPGARGSGLGESAAD